MGRRRRRLPGRQLPGAVDGVERQVPRLRAPLLAGDGGTVSELATGWPAAATCTSRAAAGRTPASTSSPATTASPCTTWSATTRSTTRPTARTTATATTTTSAGTAASRGRPTIPRIRALRERQKRNFLATLLLVAGRADAAAPATSSAARRAATTTPTARTTRSPGSTGSSTPSARDLLAFTRRLIALRRAQPVFQPAQVLPGPPHPRRRGQGHHLVRARRPGDDRRRPGRSRLRARAHGPPGRREHRRGRRARRARRRRHLRCCCSTPTPSRSCSGSRRTVPTCSWERVLDTSDDGMEAAAAACAATATACRAASLALLPHPPPRLERWRAGQPTLGRLAGARRHGASASGRRSASASSWCCRDTDAPASPRCASGRTARSPASLPASAPATATATGSTATARSPIRLRASSPRACTGRREVVDPRRSPGPTPAGAASARRDLVDLRAARRHLHAAPAPSPPRRGACRTCATSASPPSS